jgi:hypothetical protein
MATAKSRGEIEEVLDRVAFMDRKIILLEKGDGFLLQVQYFEADVHTGLIALQKARKWYVSPFMTETELVETAFKACRTSMEHVLKEHFLYKGRRVYSPHFSIDGRVDLCDAEMFDSRE